MSDSTSSPGQILRAAVADNAIQVPGAPSALVGRLIEEMGFVATYVSGAAVSAGVLAKPDIGLMTLDDLTTQVKYLAERVTIPIIVDADTGFGEADDVAPAIIALERAGAAAIQLEDQVPAAKRCGHLDGKTLISVETMCAKIRAAAAARTSSDTIIIARTDARAVEGFDAALARSRQYIAAGADWLFPEALTTREEFEAFAGAMQDTPATADVPLMANMTEFGKSPLLDFDDLADLGYRVVIYPVTLLRVAMKAIESTLTLIAADGTQRELLDLMQTRQELYDLLDYEVK